MICDDETDLLNLYKIALRSRFDVVTVCSGKSCIEKYVDRVNNGEKTEALLIDYRLGDMLGDEVACKIKELNGTKVVLISAYELEPKLVEDLKRRKCIVATIRKPISLLDLVKTVEELLSC